MCAGDHAYSKLSVTRCCGMMWHVKLPLAPCAREWLRRAVASAVSTAIMVAALVGCLYIADGHQTRPHYATVSVAR